MKTVKSIAACVSVVCLAYSASARIGETIAQIESRYGKPTDTDPPSDSVKRMTANQNIRRAWYETQGFRVEVEFTAGRSVVERIRRVSADLNDADVKVLLKAQGNGKEWKEVPSNKKNVRRWETEDNSSAIKSGNSMTFTAAAKGL